MKKNYVLSVEFSRDVVSQLKLTIRIDTNVNDLRAWGQERNCLYERMCTYKVRHNHYKPETKYNPKYTRRKCHHK